MTRSRAHNREHFDAHGVLAINLMSSPGAGKTALLEATIVALRDRYRIAVIEGDLETDNDAARIRAHGVPAVQITTGTACHLDAHLVHRALHELPLAGLDLLFIENVGNLVCPGELRSRAALERHAALRHRRRRQAGEVPGDLPRLRSGRAEQDRSARCAGRFRSGARRRGAARARPRHTDDTHGGAARARCSAPGSIGSSRSCRRPRAVSRSASLRPAASRNGRGVMHVPCRSGAGRGAPR